MKRASKNRTNCFNSQTLPFISPLNRGSNVLEKPSINVGAINVTITLLMLYLALNTPFVSPCRPLTQEEIAQRRELARQRHAERMAAEQIATVGQQNHSVNNPVDIQARGQYKGKFNTLSTFLLLFFSPCQFL